MGVYNSIVLFVIGLLIIFNPTVVWKINHGWKFKDPIEPSDLYITITRISGAILCILAVVFFVQSIINFVSS